MKIYFETSAVNAFAERHTIEDAVATRAFQSARGRSWHISPTTIWEILLTRDSTRKEYLIQICQHLFSARLMPSPEELVVDFIRQGCPVVEAPRLLESRTSLARTWKTLYDDPSQTFVYNREDLMRRVTALLPMSRLIRAVIKSRGSILASDCGIAGVDLTLEGLLRRTDLGSSNEAISSHQRTLFKLAIVFMLTCMCAEGTLNAEVYHEFWDTVGIDSTEDRIIYLLENHEPLVHRGPFIYMGMMALRQSSAPFSRGVYFDCLHSLCVPFVEIFLTNDKHFLEWREELSDHPLSERIRGYDEVLWTFHPMNLERNA